MRPEQAQSLKDGQKVRVIYKGNPGHSSNINQIGAVQGCASPITSHMGIEFCWVNVYLPSQKHASSFASHFVHLI